MGLDSAKQTSSLAPGFRFHPTDEELVRYYLRRKICGKPFRFDAISKTDVYKSEPWDLPDKSRLKSRDLEWYFFSVLDKKYGSRSRTNRATEKGYWKTTGKDREILHRSRAVGMKKTLVYHSGRAPRGERTNWVMHEYRLVDEQLEGAGIAQDAFVLCRIFQKSGSGPKNGERYGAPFVEEEWEDDELDVVPRKEAGDEFLVDDDAYLDGNDLEEILDASIPSEDASIPLNVHQGDNSDCVEESTNFDAQKLFLGRDENHCTSEQLDDQKLFDMPAQHNTEAKPVKHEYICEQSYTTNTADADYLLDEPVLDATDNPPFTNGAFLETNDLSNSVEADSTSFDMLEECMMYFDADGDNSHYMAFNCPEMVGNDTVVPDQPSVTEKHQHLNEETTQVVMANQELSVGQNSNVASSSTKPEQSEFGSDNQYPPFLKQASHILGNTPAPPAFASEFPTKDSDLWLNSAFASEFPTKDAALRLNSSSSIHVTAGMIQVRNTATSATDWSFSKPGNINIILYFDLSRSHGNSASLESTPSVLPRKALSVISRGWFYLMFMWVLLFSTSFKIGSFIYSGNAS